MLFPSLFIWIGLLIIVYSLILFKLVYDARDKNVRNYKSNDGAPFQYRKFKMVVFFFHLIVFLIIYEIQHHFIIAYCNTMESNEIDINLIYVDYLAIYFKILVILVWGTANYLVVIKNCFELKVLNVHDDIDFLLIFWITIFGFTCVLLADPYSIMQFILNPPPLVLYIFLFVLFIWARSL